MNRAVAKTAARVAASKSPVPGPTAESEAPRVTSAAGAAASRAMTTRERMKRAFGKQSGDAADAGPTPEPTPEPESEPVSGGGGGGGSSGGSSGGSGGGDQNGLLLPEAPDALTPAAQARLEEVGAQIEAAGTAVTELPTAGESTAQARGAVVEPQAEQDALAQAALVTEIDNRPPPSPEIEAACERIREVIRAKRPPDEERLVEAQPREMAQEAGQEMNADVEARAGSVREGYADMQGQRQGEPGRPPVPVELPPEQVATPPLDAGTAAPDELTADDVSLEEDVAAQEQRMEDAGMTTEPAQLVEDGPIADANDSVGELESMAQSDPQRVLAEQAAAVARAQGDMQELQAAAELLLLQARAGAVQDLERHSSHVTGSEEEQRAQAGARMQAVFQRTQQAVDGLLQPLAETALARWNAGIETLSTAFEGSLASVAQRIEERYQTEDDWDPLDEIGAAVTRLSDETFGLPDWVVEEYDRAEAAFGDGATALIRDISRDVNAVIRDCQELIQQARRDIDAIVQSLPAELQAWAQGEAAQLGERLDALGAQVTEAQSNLNRDLVERANTAVQEVRERVHALRVAAGGLLGRIAAAIEEFLRDPARAIVNGLLRLVGIPPASFWSLIERLSNVIAGIAEDPLGFADTLMTGVGQGFEQFFDNFSDHLGEALFEWLFSKLGEAGVTIPPDFSARSILGLILDVLGISWARIRTIPARHIGEENAELLDQAYQILSTLMERGPQGLIDMFVEQLDPQTIVDMLLEVALDYIMKAIMERVAVRLLLLFNPVGAILQAIEAIYRVISWIINNAAKIFTLIESIVDGAAAILAGDTSGVANLVEASLVRLMVIVIDFLAGYLGLGGIPEAIRDLILGLQSRVEAVLDRIIGFIADRARALLELLRGDEEEPEPESEATEESSGVHRRAGELLAGRLGGEVPQDRSPIERALLQVHAELASEGLRTLEVESIENEPGAFEVFATASPRQRAHKFYISDLQLGFPRTALLATLNGTSLGRYTNRTIRVDGVNTCQHAERVFVDDVSSRWTAIAEECNVQKQDNDQALVPNIPLQVTLTRSPCDTAGHACGDLLGGFVAAKRTERYPLALNLRVLSLYHGAGSQPEEVLSKLRTEHDTISVVTIRNLLDEGLIRIPEGTLAIDDTSVTDANGEKKQIGKSAEELTEIIRRINGTKAGQ